MSHDIPWIIGAIAAAGFFAVWETMAFWFPDRFNTLSHVVATVGKWPFSIWLMGGATWGLAAHFFWPWCANPLGQGMGLLQQAAPVVWGAAKFGGIQ